MENELKKAANELLGHHEHSDGVVKVTATLEDGKPYEKEFKSYVLFGLERLEDNPNDALCCFTANGVTPMDLMKLREKIDAVLARNAQQYIEQVMGRLF